MHICLKMAQLGIFLQQPFKEGSYFYFLPEPGIPDYFFRTARIPNISFTFPPSLSGSFRWSAITKVQTSTFCNFLSAQTAKMGISRGFFHPQGAYFRFYTHRNTFFSYLNAAGLTRAAGISILGL